MKKHFFLLIVLILLFPMAVFCQTPVETFTFVSITDAVQQFVTNVNWFFVLVFMLSAWLINDSTDAQNVTGVINLLTKVPKAIRTLSLGVILIFVFSYFFNFNTKADVFKMLISLLLSMVIYKLGIDKIFAFISERIGFKFN